MAFTDEQILAMQRLKGRGNAIRKLKDELTQIRERIRDLQQDEVRLLGILDTHERNAGQDLEALRDLMPTRGPNG